MATAIKLSDAPFRDVDHALESAYRAESVDIVKVSSAIAQLRGGTIKTKAPMTPHDWLTQAAFILNLMRRRLPQQMRDALDAYYTVPRGLTLEARKENSVRLLSFGLWEQMGEVPDRWYLCDVARGWARHGQRQHEDSAWALKIGKDVRTLRNWRKGWKEHTGAVRMLDTILDGARASLEESLQEAGVCE